MPTATADLVTADSLANPKGKNLIEKALTVYRLSVSILIVVNYDYVYYYSP